MKIADRIKVGLCPNPKCRAMHIWFYDQHNNEIGSVAIRPDHIQSFIEDMKGFAYTAAVMREEK